MTENANSENLLPGLISWIAALFVLGVYMGVIVGVFILLLTIWLFIVGDVSQSHAIKSITVLIVLGALIVFVRKL